MADPHSQLDKGQLDASTKLEKRKDFKDSIISPCYDVDPSQTKTTHPIKYSEREFLSEISRHIQSLGDQLVDNRPPCLIPGLSLDLSGRGLKELHPVLFMNCYEIEDLNLSNNCLTHANLYPVGEMYRLKKLDLSGCGLKMFPPALLKNGENIEELNLSNNPLVLSGLYPIRYMYRLKKLDLSGCGLKELPSGFLEYCREIEELNLSNNPFSHSDLNLIRHMDTLKKLDVSGCGLSVIPCDLKTFLNLQELNLSNNFFDHQDLLEELNSGKKFDLRGKDLCKLGYSGIHDLSRLASFTFEDAVYTKSGGVWTMKVREDAAIVPAGKMTYKVSLPYEETWLDEFCRIRKSEKLTIETYHSMLKSLKILVTLVGDNVESCFGQNVTLNRCFFEIKRFLWNIEVSEDGPSWRTRRDVRITIFYLKEVVSRLLDSSIGLAQVMTVCADATKELSRAFLHCVSIENGVLVAKLKIISQIISNLTKAQAAIPCSLQSLQKLHDLPAVQKVFTSLNSFLGSEETDSVVFFAKSIFKINKILFEFVQAFFRPPPTIEEWPVTIQLQDKSIYNPLTDKRLMDAEKGVSRETKSHIHEVDNDVQHPVTDVAVYSYMIVEICGQTADSSITVDQKGGCFSLPEVCAFLLFPPNAVDEKVTLKCRRVKHKECKVKLSDGEVFVSRILKIEPEGVTFKQPVTVLLSHSLDEDEDFLYFYELIVENLSPTGYQELKTEPISSIKDVPKQICNKKVLDDYLPLAKATIQESCTLAAVTRARLHQILIPTKRHYVFCKQYGDIAELKITFPAGVTEEILSLKVQLFPADAVVNKDIRLNKSLVCAPVVRVSGQKTSFLKAVDVELTYSHSDVANIEEEFLPVGKTIQFTTEYGLLLRIHNETESNPNWQALNKSNDVSIERSRQDQLKFSFSVKHFSDVQPVVKTSAVSYVPPTNTSMVTTKNPACHHAIVLAVHDTGSSPKTLRAILAPKLVKHHLQSKWKVEPLRFMNRLKCEEPIYFCVPISDTKESLHLSLEDYTLWFDPDDESELSNSTTDDDDLRGKEMRFLKDRECNNGENHTTQGDCRAKFPIHTFESRSVLQTGTEDPEILQDRMLPKECNVSSDQEEAPKSVNKVSKVILQRCKSFETTVESLAEEKLKINKASVEDPKGGKATKFVDVAGPAATIICSLAGGITIAMSVATFGATSLATALVASAVLAVKIVDKHAIQAKAKVVKDVVSASIETANVSSYLNCVVKDVAKELSRIFEYQLLHLENDEQIKILAECAVDLMLDLKKPDTFDRNTLLKKVLHDGQINKRKLVTKIKDIKWSAPNVFRKPGLRRIIFGKDVAKFQYFVKPNDSCKAWKYGYRGQFLELKKYDSQNDKGETSSTDETHSEDPNCDTFCKKCSSNCRTYPSGHYFSESDIDAQYTDDPQETLTYHPLHILIQCPNVLDCFQQFQGKRPPLACFLKRELGLPEDRIVHPVYRPHSPGKVSDLQKSDFTGSDFSHCDFTDSCFEDCDFAKCVMLFTNLAGAKFSGSRFCDTFISHCNLKNVVADHCEWTKTSLLYSRVDGAHVESVEPSIAGNCLDGTNICDAITTKMNEIHCDKEDPPRERMSESSNSGAGTSADHYEGSASVPSNVNGTRVETLLPYAGGSCSNGKNIHNANMRKTKCNETPV